MSRLKGRIGGVGTVGYNHEFGHPLSLVSDQRSPPITVQRLYPIGQAQCSLANRFL